MKIKVKHVMFVMLCIGIALGVNTLHDRHAAQQPEPVAEQATAAPEEPTLATEPVVVTETNLVLVVEVTSNEIAQTSVQTQTNNTFVLKVEDFDLKYK